MGYILPVTPHQSIQYAEREVGKKQNPYRFVPTVEVMNDFEYENYIDDGEKFVIDDKGERKKKKQQREMKFNENEDESKMHNKSKAYEKVTAEVTGKGANISEFV